MYYILAIVVTQQVATVLRFVGIVVVCEFKLRRCRGIVRLIDTSIKYGDY
jgi:hypothetical protein